MIPLSPNLSPSASFPAKRRWFARPWVIFLFVVGIVLLVIIALFSFRIIRYTNEIQLQEYSTNAFTQTVQLDAPPQVSPPSSLFDARDDPTYGNPNADVVIVEFGDFECPFCRQAFPTVRELQAEYGSDVLFVWRDFPLREIHPRAQKTAEAAACAHDQGKFWEYHDKLFINQLRFTNTDLKQYARELGLDTSRFSTCLDSGQHAEEIERDRQAAIALGAQGTPTFLINGQVVAGVLPKETFEQIIGQLLNNKR